MEEMQERITGGHVAQASAKGRSMQQKERGGRDSTGAKAHANYEINPNLIPIKTWYPEHNFKEHPERPPKYQTV